MSIRLRQLRWHLMTICSHSLIAESWLRAEWKPTYRIMPGYFEPNQYVKASS